MNIHWIARDIDIQKQRDFRILCELDQNGSATQRTLATRLGVALGLTNLYLTRLVRKGYFKVTTLPRNRIRYLLTPRGVAEKSQLTVQYMQHSLAYYRDMRGRLNDMLSSVDGRAGQRMVIYGTTELAELAYLSLREKRMICVGFLDGRPRASFLSCPVSLPEGIAAWQFDWVLIADLEHATACEERLAQSGVPSEKILRLSRMRSPRCTA